MEQPTANTEYHPNDISENIRRYGSGDYLLAKDIPLSDLGNAQRLVLRHRVDLRYVPQWGKWVAWDGTRWAVDDNGEVMRRAKETVLTMYDAALRLSEGDEEDEKVEFALRSQSARVLRAMVALAQSENTVPVDANDLNADPFLLNVQNGTLDLYTGELHEHRREDHITKCAPVAYDPEAKAPRWLEFLDHILDGRTELIEYVQMAVGYTLTGSTREQCWFITYGSGSNGKSLFLSILRDLLGEREYARHTPIETLMASRNADRVRNDLARLQGARLVTATETEDGQRLAASLVKQMTGEDPMTCRYLYQEFIEFRPTFKLWLGVNFKPKIRSDDPASWRRIRLIPFTVMIPDDRQDKHLHGKLQAELPGILNWALEGCLAWQQTKGGLVPPTCVAEATTQYRSEMATVGRFIEQECLVSPQQWVSAADLYGEYQTWCTENGEYLESQKRLATQLRQRGFESQKSAGVRGWRGLSLRPANPGLTLVK